MVNCTRALKPQRSLDVRVPFQLYQIIGCRPSAVYVDDDLKPMAAGDEPNRLRELVYRHGRAVPGEQIHLASGRTFVLDAHNVYRGVLLIDPRPISIEDALTHAAQDRASEESKIEDLILAGAVIDALPRRSHTAALPRYDRLYAAGQPLVVE